MIVVSHRHVEIVIGRLVTDEEFRRRFVESPTRWLEELNEAGFELSAAELAALRRTDIAAWLALADALDPRLQKASLKPLSRGPRV
jgi:hypothetical protein